MTLNALLNAPLYEGAATSPLVPSLYQVAIAGHPYLIEPTEYDRDTIDPQRSPVTTSGEVGEATLNPLAAWRQVTADWSGGAGQEWRDGPDADTARFFTSKGFDPWDPGRLRMLAATRSIWAHAADPSGVLSVGSHLYAWAGGTARFTADPDAEPPVWTDLTGLPGGNITALVVAGDVVYLAVAAGGVWKATVGQAAATQLAMAGQTLDCLGVAAGRLLAGVGKELSEIDAAGTATVVATLAHGAWAGIVSSPLGVYAWADDAQARSILYRLGVDNTGALDPPVAAGGPPDGELLRTVVHYGGLQVWGTTVGLRLAVYRDGGTVEHGSAVEEPGEVTALECEGRFVWFSWADYDAESTGLGRADLSRLTAGGTLTPAFASDLMVTGTGAIGAITTHAAKRWFSVDGLGAYGEDTDLVAEATLTSSKDRFGIYDPKLVTSATVAVEPLDGTLALAVIDDAGVEKAVATLANAGATGPDTPWSLGSYATEALRTRLTATRDSVDLTAGPVVTRVLLRAYPQVTPVDAILVPVVARPALVVGGGEGTTVAMDVAAELAYLRGLRANRQVVRYQEGDTTERVIVEKVRFRPDRWDDDRKALMGLILVTLKTVEA